MRGLCEGLFGPGDVDVLRGQEAVPGGGVAEGVVGGVALDEFGKNYVARDAGEGVGEGVDEADGGQGKGRFGGVEASGAVCLGAGGDADVDLVVVGVSWPLWYVLFLKTAKVGAAVAAAVKLTKLMPSSVTVSLSLSTLFTLPTLPLTPSLPSITTTRSPSLTNQSFVLYRSGTFGGFTLLALNDPKKSSRATPAACPPTSVPATVAYAAAARHGEILARSQSSRRDRRASLIVAVCSLRRMEFCWRNWTRSRMVRLFSRMRALRAACAFARAVRRRTPSIFRCVKATMWWYAICSSQLLVPELYIGCKLKAFPTLS